MRGIALGVAWTFTAIMAGACWEAEKAPRAPDGSWATQASAAPPGGVGRSIAVVPVGADDDNEDDLDASGFPVFPGPPGDAGAGLGVPQPPLGPTGTGFAPGAGGFGNNGGGVGVGANNIGSDNGSLVPDSGAAGATGTGGTNTSGTGTNGDPMGTNMAGVGSGSNDTSGGDSSSHGVANASPVEASTNEGGGTTVGVGAGTGSQRCSLPRPPFEAVVRATSGSCDDAAYLVEPAVPIAGFTEFVPTSAQGADSCIVTATRTLHQGCTLEQSVTCTSGKSQRSRCTMTSSSDIACRTEIGSGPSVCTVDATFWSMR